MEHLFYAGTFFLNPEFCSNMKADFPFQQLKDRAQDASRTARRMLALTCSTKSAVAHDFVMTTAERALTQDLDTDRIRVFADLYPCTTRRAPLGIATTT